MLYPQGTCILIVTNLCLLDVCEVFWKDKALLCTNNEISFSEFIHLEGFCSAPVGLWWDGLICPV